MDDLIAALTIMRKYGNPVRPVNCVHDEMHVNVDPGLVSADDIATLDYLGFFPAEGGFMSFRFGSC